MSGKEKAPFVCSFCNKRYKQEAAFIRHRCQQIIRHEQMQTPVGQAAWQFYQTWMKYQHKRVPDNKTFLRSRYYQSFYRFATFVNRSKLTNVDVFIKLMITKGYSPTMWLNEQVYVMYMEHLDRQLTPLEQIQNSLTTLDNVVDENDNINDISEVFDVLTASEIIELVKHRKLSPWLLLFSSKFFKLLQKTQTENIEQYVILNSLIRKKFWEERFMKFPKDVNTARLLVSKLNL